MYADMLFSLIRARRLLNLLAELNWVKMSIGSISLSSGSGLDLNIEAIAVRHEDVTSGESVNFRIISRGRTAKTKETREDTTKERAD